MEKCEIYPTKNGRFRWRTRDAGNNKITAYGGENFASYRNAVRAFQGHKGEMTAEVEIVDKRPKTFVRKVAKKRTEG